MFGHSKQASFLCVWLNPTSIPISFPSWHQTQLSSFFKLFQVDISKNDSSLHNEKILIDIGPSYVKYYNHRFRNIPSAFICNIHWSCKKKEKMHTLPCRGRFIFIYSLIGQRIKICLHVEMSCFIDSYTFVVFFQITFHKFKFNFFWHLH